MPETLRHKAGDAYCTAPLLICRAREQIGYMGGEVLQAEARGLRGARADISLFRRCFSLFFTGYFSGENESISGCWRGFTRETPQSSETGLAGH
jgi:hypothetical protein